LFKYKDNATIPILIAVKESGTKQEKTNVGALVTTQQLEEDKETLPQHRENKEMTNAIKERYCS